ncbi:unnamed protein product [Linum trigynum]|uniref:LOB domain-containing protein n=1 Tax=Linum trigynum TaxID=586398 RepID=A0AAV2ECE9_9ROSI
MTGSGSPCGACKFLRRKCARGCVFAPYFCHEQGAAHFAAIHKVFGASNVSKLLAHLPVTDRCEAAVTISYEAQARLQDPIYGCVSHIFALQQQVVNLQAQLASMREQASHHNFAYNMSSATSANPNNSDHRHYGNHHSAHNPIQDLQSWLQDQYPCGVPNSNNMVPQPYNQSPDNMNMAAAAGGGGYVGNYGSNNSSTSFDSFEDASNSMSSMDINETDQQHSRRWRPASAYNHPQDQADDDLQSVAFGYFQH